MAHWYPEVDGTPELKQYVPNASKPGQLRPYTLRDARKERALPSTTTKLGLINKFILNEWIRKETIKLTIQECSQYSASYMQGNWPAILEDVLRKAEEQSTWAANFGTRVHKAVSSLLGGEPYAEPELDELDLVIADNVVAIPSAAMMAEFGDFTKVNAVALATKDWMDANGFKCLETEYLIFCRELGIAGTADWIGLHYGSPCVLDIKTQDAEDTSKFNKWPEVGMQLADYVTGLCAMEYWGLVGNPPDIPQREDIERISLYTSRTHPGVILPYQWNDMDDFKKMEMISEYYWLDKKYDPRVESNEPRQESLI